LAFDWRQPLEAKRLLLLATLCSMAFFAAVGVSGSLVALDSVGMFPIMAANALAATILAGSLRLVAVVEPERKELGAAKA
jgi:hypothetical protein